MCRNRAHSKLMLYKNTPPVEEDGCLGPRTNPFFFTPLEIETKRLHFIFCFLMHYRRFGKGENGGSGSEWAELVAIHVCGRGLG